MKKISIIGGITADIEGTPYNRLIHGDSNPGKIALSYGGVGRNITENLARMGANVGFVSVAGDDFPGRGALRELKELGVNVEHVKLLPEENTAVYMSILNIVGDMELALCNMDVLERISNTFIDEVAEDIGDSAIIGIDTNLTAETLADTADKLSGIPLFLDPVSVTKAERAKNIIGRFHTIKPNRMEAEVLSGIRITSEEELEKAGQWFLSEGVERVFISLGAGGVYFTDRTDSGILRPKPVKVVSATGAGDAFSAAVLYGFVQGLSVKETALYGMAAAAVTLESKTSVNSMMSQEKLKAYLSE
jgi:pseudouridine kinase